jgi:hypothetical protein
MVVEAMVEQNLDFFIPITKIDLVQRQVWGRATQEVLDKARPAEIMDYESSVPYFKAWSGDVEKASQGKSKGNIRVMHRPDVAAGKIIAIDYNDAEKAIDIGTYIADDQEWAKCEAGVYTGFSVGGDYAKRWPDIKNPGAIRYTASPKEISLVDRPAVPTATYSLVKADGATEERHFLTEAELEAAAQGIEKQEIPPVRIVPDGEVVKPIDPTIVGGMIEAHGVVPISTDEEPDEAGMMAEVEKNADMKKLSSDIEKLTSLVSELTAFQKMEAKEKEKVLADLTSRGKRVGIARRSDEPTVPLKGQPSDLSKFGDPANYQFPISNESELVKALADYNGARGRDKYAPQEWSILGRRITRMASELGTKHVFSPKDQQVRLEKKMLNLDALSKADVASLLRSAQSTVNSAVEMIGKDPQQAADMLTQVVAALDVADDVQRANVSEASPHGPKDGAAVAIVKADAATTPTASDTGATATGSSPSSETDTKTGTATATDTATKTATATETEPAKPAKPAKKEDGDSDLRKEVANLTEQVTKLFNLVQKQAPVAKSQQDGPLGDLNALVKVEQDAAIDALQKGDMVTALKESNGNINVLYEKLDKAVMSNLMGLGINSQRIQIANWEQPVK